MKNKTVLELYKIKPLNQDIIIFCSNKFENLPKELNKKSNKNISKFFSKYVQNRDTDKDVCGLVKSDIRGRPRLLFIQLKYNKNFILENIMHEVSHVIDMVSDYYDFKDETEFKAYLTETLNRDIRELIYGK